jgi:hypothetical protein
VRGFAVDPGLSDQTVYSRRLQEWMDQGIDLRPSSAVGDEVGGGVAAHPRGESRARHPSSRRGAEGDHKTKRRVAAVEVIAALCRNAIGRGVLRIAADSRMPFSRFSTPGTPRVIPSLG